MKNNYFNIIVNLFIFVELKSKREFHLLFLLTENYLQYIILTSKRCF